MNRQHLQEKLTLLPTPLPQVPAPITSQQRVLQDNRRQIRKRRPPAPIPPLQIQIPPSPQIPIVVLTLRRDRESRPHCRSERRAVFRRIPDAPWLKLPKTARA